MLNRRRIRGAVAVGLSAVAVLALASCDSESGKDASPQSQGSTGPAVVAPGKPGEPAKRISPAEASKLLPDDKPNAADFGYAQMMIVHHRQALTMTALVPDRAGSAQITKLADRISAAQKPEIGALEGWLKSNGGPREQSGSDHRTMPGMATEAQLAQLRAAKGKAFDELFLKLMITHHGGAVTMAAEVLGNGNNVLVEEMANDVIAQQTAEINRMQGM
ncbi:DUF305 domain-containing protein [Streptomyces sp. P9(2023)]|uniref:DUF305 domain-containing protein n=1 Tax=Streptomyces sp. P9(2023) TaxID=3064394 RepID=UPI0028F43BB2|nr:DUF305 domain-containing protein [Streptomyces sp. P9(2023)]MDT9687490.1 DUF305 domain-containing protein [Streptomyces sp. P9(2023)]